jgi:UDP-2-acetamido-3-amino-2,3-dideoxy-glucuronate N-acetyltransferase
MVLSVRNPMKKVAVLGCGQWGRNLVRNLAQLGELGAVYDLSEKALGWVRNQYPDIRVVSSSDEILSDPTIQAVVVATPPSTHGFLARKALRAGKDAFVEKPLALGTAEGQALVDLAERHGRILMVGHILEYHPALVRLRELVVQGELGKIQYVYSNRLNLGRIRTEENALWSFAPHDVHAILGILGEEPTEVSCQGASYLQQKLADVTVTLLSFASGVQGHIFVSWLHPFKEQKLVVVGDRKMALFDDTLPTNKLQLFPHRVDWVDRVPIAMRAEAEPVLLPDLEPLLEECRHFLHCVETRDNPRTDGASGVRVLKVLEACQTSLNRGGVPVKLRTSTTASREATYFAHPTAVIDPDAEIGASTRIWHFSHIMEGVRIGQRCTLGQNTFVGRNVVIGNNVKIQNNVSIYEGVALEDDVFCGPSMVFTNVSNPRSHVPRKDEFRPTLVRRGATLGANATIICGCTIGSYAFVGAGAVVTRDVPDYALVLGAPARIKGWMCECGVRLEFQEAEASCQSCGSRYSKSKEGTRVAAIPGVCT